ncbi:baeRF11 domain-containing protein [Aquibaculum sediminis]|uniref:baeRF11 domain-containing protein n=1 Tax=Aquibaculum sediminis TaxID=3231907 RepID=UPI00345448B1
MREAQRQLEENSFDKRALEALLEKLHDLQDDDAFWNHQANSLAVFATPDNIRTYRLANHLTPMVQVADRFHLKPLFRAVTFPNSAFILALSENAVRLVEMEADLPPETVKVPNLPKDAASSVGKSTLNDRSFSGRIHGSEGQNVRFQQYARQVDAALRPILAGRETPLILAATGRLASVYAEVNSYPHLLADTIGESPDRLSDGELAQRARPILDAAYEKELAEVRALFERRTGERRTTTDISDAARAATFGAVDTLLVDIDSVVPGSVDDETGAVTFMKEDDATAYGVVDTIAARAFANGARVLGVRQADIPGGKELAAILRYSF